MQGAFLGPGYTSDEVGDSFYKHEPAYEIVEDEAALTAKIAAALDGGMVLGHFHGRMEYGPRALGNRSILADARPAGMFSRVNQQIKGREGWRPFAPIVLAERVGEVFDPATESPYMLF